MKAQVKNVFALQRCGLTQSNPKTAWKKLIMARTELHKKENGNTF
jgi:hypothetical protein